MKRQAHLSNDFKSYHTVVYGMGDKTGKSILDLFSMFRFALKYIEPWLHFHQSLSFSNTKIKHNIHRFFKYWLAVSAYYFIDISKHTIIAKYIYKDKVHCTIKRKSTDQIITMNNNALFIGIGPLSIWQCIKVHAVSTFVLTTIDASCSSRDLLILSSLVQVK